MTTRVAELLARVLPPERIGHFAGGHGHRAAPMAAPGSPEEAAEVVQLARAERWVVLPLGNGTRLAWIRPRERVDLVLSSRNLRGIRAYEPADGTLTALAGTPWAELAAATAGRHHLSPELADGTATLGGTLASGTSGFDRLRHGPLRHQILGLSALHADGTRVQSGGRVVKNVTGYDLHRLWCGSEGTLCFLIEGTLRLHAAPAECALLVVRAPSAAEAVGQGQRLWRAGVQPLAAVVRAAELGGPAELTLVLTGRPEAVDAEAAVARASARVDDELRGAAAEAARTELCRASHSAVLALAARPSLALGALAALDRATRALGLTTRVGIHPLLATIEADFPGSTPGDERVLELAEDLARAGLRARWRGLGARAPRTQPAAAVMDLMQRLKRSLDPQGLFAGGPP